MIRMVLLIWRVLILRSLCLASVGSINFLMRFSAYILSKLQFNTFDAMFTGMNKKKTKKGGKAARGRAKGRQKGPSTK